MSEEKPAEDHTKFIASMRLECAAFGAMVGAIVGFLFAWNAVHRSMVLQMFLWGVLLAALAGGTAMGTALLVSGRFERDSAAGVVRFVAVLALGLASYAVLTWAA